MAEWSNTINIAIDDIDAPSGGCTTHFTGLLLHALRARKAEIELVDYPLLVRLNPGVPWKTRGNAATVLRVRGIEWSEALELASWLAAEYTRERPKEPGKEPGIVVLQGYPWKRPLRLLYRMALTGITPLDYARTAVEKAGGAAWGGRGVIGAAAAIAALAPWDDYTYELLYYRRPERWDTPRCVKQRGEARIPPCTFANSGHESAAAAPHGHDPVLAGFRGDCPEKLFLYREWLCEEPHFWVLYRTNQHTDAPALIGVARTLHPYNYFAGWAVVSSSPRKLPGGHVVVDVATTSGLATLAFYRESWPLNEAARKLAPGDKLWVMGSVRPYGEKPTVAVDKMRIAKLASLARRIAPLCPRCGRRMKSAGRGKGYKCPKCGYRDPNAKPLVIEYPRSITPGWYAPRDDRLRHTTAPPWRKPQHVTPKPPSWSEVMGTTRRSITRG